MQVNACLNLKNPTGIMEIEGRNTVSKKKYLLGDLAFAQGTPEQNLISEDRPSPMR